MISMTPYEDEAILLDKDGVTIKNYRRPGDTKRIAYGSIQSFEAFEMGLWTGRYRLVGMSLGRPRNWFHWDRQPGAPSTLRSRSTWGNGYTRPLSLTIPAP